MLPIIEKNGKLYRTTPISAAFLRLKDGSEIKLRYSFLNTIEINQYIKTNKKKQPQKIPTVISNCSGNITANPTANGTVDKKNTNPPYIKVSKASSKGRYLDLQQ